MTTAQKRLSADAAFRWVRSNIGHLRFDYIDRATFDERMAQVWLKADALGYSHLLRKRVANDDQVSAALAASL